MIFFPFIHVCLRQGLLKQTGWPETQDHSAPASRMLGLQLCVTTPRQDL